MKIVIDIGDESELKEALKAGMNGLIQNMVRDEVQAQIRDIVKAEVEKKLKSFDYEGTTRSFVYQKVGDAIGEDNRWRLADLQRFVARTVDEKTDVLLSQVDIKGMVRERVANSIRMACITVKVDDP